MIESSVDIVPLGWVPDFSQSTPTNNQPYVAVSRKYGTSAATASRLTSTLNGIGFSARAFNADGTSGSFTIFNPGTGSIGNTRHTLYLQPNDLRVDDRHALTCNLLDSALIEQGNISESSGAEVASTNRLRSGFCGVKASTSYTLSMSSSAEFKIALEYNSSKGFVGYKFLSGTSCTFTTDANVAFVRITIGFSNDGTITPSDVSNVQLESGRYASSFVPYTMDGVEIAQCIKGEKIYFTPINCTPNAEGCYFINKGVSVYVHLGISNISASNNIANILWHSIPQNLRPKHYCGFGGWQYASDWSSTSACAVTVNPDGDIHVFASLPNVFADFEYTIL